MEKAYDLVALGAKLKDKGLDVAEDTAKHVYDAVKEWLKESAVLSTNPFDNMVSPFYDQADALVYPAIDKIDGEVG